MPFECLAASRPSQGWPDAEGGRNRAVSAITVTYRLVADFVTQSSRRLSCSPQGSRRLFAATPASSKLGSTRAGLQSLWDAYGLSSISLTFRVPGLAEAACKLSPLQEIPTKGRLFYDRSLLGGNTTTRAAEAFSARSLSSPVSRSQESSGLHAAVTSSVSYVVPDCRQREMRFFLARNQYLTPTCDVRQHITPLLLASAYMSKGRAPKSQASTRFRSRRHALKSSRKAADFSKHTRRMPKLHLCKPFEVSGSITMSCKPEQQGSYPCSRSVGKPNHEASECLPQGQGCLEVDPGPGSCQQPELPTSQRQLELLHREGPALRQKATAVPCAGLLGFRLVIKGTSSSRGTKVTTRGFRDAKGLNRQRLCKQTTDGSNSVLYVLFCVVWTGLVHYFRQRKP